MGVLTGMLYHQVITPDELSTSFVESPDKIRIVVTSSQSVVLIKTTGLVPQGPVHHRHEMIVRPLGQISPYVVIVRPLPARMAVPTVLFFRPNPGYDVVVVLLDRGSHVLQDWLGMQNLGVGQSYEVSRGFFDPHVNRDARVKGFKLERKSHHLYKVPLVLERLWRPIINQNNFTILRPEQVQASRRGLLPSPIRENQTDLQAPS